MTDPLLGEVAAEIVRLHDFFAGWFQGTIPEDSFEADIAQRLHSDFENVQPAGHVLSRDTLLEPLRGARGVNPDFRIEVSDVRLLGNWPDAGLVMAGYIEAQFGARNTVPSNNLRRSTVLFERGEHGLIWRYVHETAMDSDRGEPNQ